VNQVDALIQALQSLPEEARQAVLAGIKASGKPREE
jgi:hypothetical protein